MNPNEQPKKTRAKRTPKKTPEQESFDASCDGISGLQEILHRVRLQHSGKLYSCDATSALGLGGFYRAVDLISSTICRFDCITYRTEANNSRVPATDHPAYKLLYRRANDLPTSPQEFIRTLISDTFLYGNGVAYIKRDEAGTPTALYNLPGYSVAIAVVYKDSFYAPDIRYGVSGLGTTGTTSVNWLRPDEVIHIKGLGTNAYCGMPLLDCARSTFHLASAALNFGIYYMERSGVLHTVVELPGQFKNPQQKQEFIEQFNDGHVGLNNAFNPVFIPFGSKVSNLSIDAQEASLIGVQSRLDTTLANLCGLPPIKLGVQNAASYGSVAEENLDLKGSCYDKWATLTEAQLTLKLCTELEIESGSVYVQLDRSTLDIADVAKYSDRVIKEYQSGLRSWEDSRALLHLSTTRNENDTYIQATNMGIFGEQQPAQGNNAINQPME